MATFPLPPDKGHGAVSWTQKELAEIAEIMTHYPTKRSAMLPLLWKAQRKWGWLSLDVMRLIARTLEVPPSAVLGVSTFYTMLKKEPKGKYTLQVCQTLSCKLAGSDAIIEHIEDRLKIKHGETTPDGLFTFEAVECLASCGSGPMMQVNDDYYEQLTKVRIDEILDGFEQGKPVSNPEVDQWTFKNLES